jgi:hypothetical protein
MEDDMATKIPAYVGAQYLKRFGKRITAKGMLEEYILERYPGVVFVARQQSGPAGQITTRKLTEADRQKCQPAREIESVPEAQAVLEGGAA